jgi:hypothetical protein
MVLGLPFGCLLAMVIDKNEVNYSEIGAGCKLRIGFSVYQKQVDKCAIVEVSGRNRRQQ